MDITYFILAGLIGLSAFFSAAEVAFVSLSPAKVRLIKEKKTRAGKIVVKLKSRPQRFLATILIGNNLVNIFAAGLATMLATNIFGSSGLGIATGAMTFLILIFGEIIPKAFAQKHAEGFTLKVAYPLFLLDIVLTPISWLAEKFLHALGAKHIEKVTEEELVALVDLGTEEGEIERHEREMIQNVLEFTDTRVEEVMIPRVEIKALGKDTTVREAEKFFKENIHSRIPVFDGSVDKVVGLITLRHIFEHEGSADDPIEKLDLLEPIFTPASRPIRSLFQEFKSRHIHLAVVIDEHGGTSGLVSLEDLLEEIVGEIEDEEDVSEINVEKLNARTLLVSGDTQLDEIDKELKTRLASKEFENKNIAFLVLEKLGRMPQVNDKIRAGESEITVEEIEENRIEKVKIEKI